MKVCLVESPGTAPGSDPCITSAFIAIFSEKTLTVYNLKTEMTIKFKFLFVKSIIFNYSFYF